MSNYGRIRYDRKSRVFSPESIFLTLLIQEIDHFAGSVEFREKPEDSTFEQDSKNREKNDLTSRKFTL